MIYWDRKPSPNPHQTELGTTLGKRAQKRDFDLCFLLCFGEKWWGWDDMAHSHYPQVPHIFGFIMENINYLLFLIRGGAKPLLPGSTFLSYHTATPLVRIFPYIDGYSPHGPTKRHPGNIDCHENPGKLKFQKLLFTQVQRKLFSVMATCSNCSQIIWNKNNLIFPWKSWLFTLSALMRRLELVSFRNFALKF